MSETEQKYLYWVQESRLATSYSDARPVQLMATEIIKETDKLYILNGYADSQYVTRLEKDAANRKGFYQTPEEAWKAYRSSLIAAINHYEKHIAKCRAELEQIPT